MPSRDLNDIIMSLAQRVTDLENNIQATNDKDLPGLYTGIRRISASTTANGFDNTLFVQTTSGAITVTLPTAVGVGGRCYFVADEEGDASTNNVTVLPTGAETIDGLASVTIDQDYGGFVFQSNGANWIIVACCTSQGGIPVVNLNSYLYDAGGRQRVSELTTLGEYKLPYQDEQLFYDTVTNGTATATYSITIRGVVMTT